MRNVVLAAVLAGAAMTVPASGWADEWEILVDRGHTRVDLNVSSIEKGPNGGIQAYFLTMNARPQTTPDGVLFKNVTEVFEYDCAGERSWFHAAGYELQGKLVGVKKYPNAEPFPFLPPDTLAGATEKAACAYFRQKGLW